jgi:hypothetical protein
MADWLDKIRGELDVIRRAPLTHLVSAVVVAGGIFAVLYFAFNANLSRKDDLIRTLQGQITSAQSQAVSLQSQLDSEKSEKSRLQSRPSVTCATGATSTGGAARRKPSGTSATGAGTGSAVTVGEKSPAVTGSGNRISYGEPAKSDK